MMIYTRYLCLVFSLLITSLGFGQVNDNFAEAITINSISNYCPTNGDLTTVGATADRSKPVMWSNGPTI